MKIITAYLNFDGNCREAMTFYQRCLGGELKVMTYAEADTKTPPEAKDRLVHARLTRGELVLMASDVPPGMPPTPGNQVWLNLGCETDEEVDDLYQTFVVGGVANMPPHDAFWGARFAMLTDRFGMHWMLDHERAHVAQS